MEPGGRGLQSHIKRKIRISCKPCERDTLPSFAQSGFGCVETCPQVGVLSQYRAPIYHPGTPTSTSEYRGGLTITVHPHDSGNWKSCPQVSGATDVDLRICCQRSFHGRFENTVASVGDVILLSSLWMRFNKARRLLPVLADSPSTGEVKRC